MHPRLPLLIDDSREARVVEANIDKALGTFRGAHWVEFETRVDLHALLVDNPEMIDDQHNQWLLVCASMEHAPIRAASLRDLPERTRLRVMTVDAIGHLQRSGLCPTAMKLDLGRSVEQLTEYVRTMALEAASQRTRPRFSHMLIDALRRHEMFLGQANRVNLPNEGAIGTPSRHARGKNRKRILKRK